METTCLSAFVFFWGWCVGDVVKESDRKSRESLPPKISGTQNGGFLNLIFGYFGGGFSLTSAVSIQLL